MKPVALSPNESRRVFLRGVGRTSLLGALGLLSVMLGRRAGARPEDARCRGPAPCGGCAAFDQCSRPAALQARLAQLGETR